MKTKTQRDLEFLCECCIVNGMAFARQFQGYNYCIAVHQGIYKDKLKTQFIFNKLDVIAHKCNYEVEK